MQRPSICESQKEETPAMRSSPTKTLIPNWISFFWMRRVGDRYGEKLMCDLPSAREEEEEHEKRGVNESREERVQIDDEVM